MSAEGREVLPTSVYPDHYYVTLEPNFEDFTFDGFVKIDLSVKESTKYVTLNYLDIKFLESKINGVAVVDLQFDSQTQQARLEAAEELIAGEKATLEIKFKGELNDQMAGFYRSSYKDEKTGETKYLATTQFEATDARRAFPCFDEPALKSKFQISLIADEKLTCLANMLPVKEEKLDNGKKKVIFDSTPLLSTYLVAFIVGDLEYVENTDYKIPVRVYTTPGLSQQGVFSAALASKTLKFFAEAFDIEYYLPHMNMVAIHDFSAGAMENLSLITYRAVDLLINEKTASLSRKLRVSEVVQHELAHQWFGNLVTMKWWNDLWLNESYATYCSYMVFESYTKNADSFIWSNFEASTLQSALKLDSLRSSHPIEVDVKRADEINQIFDAISYSKGSSLLRMIANWLGKDVFLKGVSDYLKKHKFGNAETADLWAALSEASGKDVLKVMDIWTKNIGYPIIQVSENPESNEIVLEQHRFLSTGDVKPEEDTVCYPIFVNLKDKAGKVKSDLTLTARSESYKLDDFDFFKVNANGVGFYRTLYPPSRWAAFGKQHDLLSIEDRTTLVDDAFNLAVSGYSSTINFLNLITQWTNEEDYIVWDAMLNGLGEILSVFKFYKIDYTVKFFKLVNHLISKKLEEIGYDFKEDEDPLQHRLRATLFASAAFAASKDDGSGVYKFVEEKFAAFTAGDKESINPNIKAAVFATIARLSGTEADYENIYSIYLKHASLDEKLIALQTLGKFKSPELICKTLKHAMNSEVVKPQDIYIPLQGLRNHKEGIIALWKWMTTNWTELTTKFPPSLNMLGNIVTLCTSGYLVEGGIQEIKDFFKDKDCTGFDLNLHQSLDSLTSKSTWLSRDGQQVADWLEKHY